MALKWLESLRRSLEVQSAREDAKKVEGRRLRTRVDGEVNDATTFFDRLRVVLGSVE